MPDVTPGEATSGCVVIGAAGCSWLLLYERLSERPARRCLADGYLAREWCPKLHLRFVGPSYGPWEAYAGAPKGQRCIGPCAELSFGSSSSRLQGLPERDVSGMAFEFAQFVALTDDPVRLPDPRLVEFWPAYDEVALKIENIDLPNLNADRTAVLAFKVTPYGGGRLRMRFNDRAGPSIDRVFTQLRTDGEQVPEPPVARSWHEIVAGRLLKPENNSLVISLTPQADIPPFALGPYVVISDIVIFYHGIVDQVS
jgi:hypothetical protein